MTPKRAQAIAAVGKRRIEQRLEAHAARREELASKLMRVEDLTIDNANLRSQIAMLNATIAESKSAHGERRELGSLHGLVTLLLDSIRHAISVECVDGYDVAVVVRDATDQIHDLCDQRRQV